MAFDLLATCSREWLVYGGRPSMPVLYVAWAYAVDAALTPIALFAAIAADARPELLLGLAPLALLLVVFARERTARIDRVLELQAAYRGTALMLGDVIEGDDVYTGEHSEGVVTLVLAVARELGLDAEETRLAGLGALLHDIGKIRVPKEIINKPGPLTADEFEVVKAHPIEGQRMLDRVGGLLSDVGVIVRSHHERFDGAGYPDGLQGDEIPLLARVIAVCDTFSAITTTRPYRRARSVEAALAEISACAGAQVDPRVVQALERAVTRVGPGALLAPPSHLLDALSEAA